VFNTRACQPPRMPQSLRMRAHSPLLWCGNRRQSEAGEEWEPVMGTRVGAHVVGLMSAFVALVMLNVVPSAAATGTGGEVAGRPGVTAEGIRAKLSGADQRRWDGLSDSQQRAALALLSDSRVAGRLLSESQARAISSELHVRSTSGSTALPQDDRFTS